MPNPRPLTSRDVERISILIDNFVGSNPYKVWFDAQAYIEREFPNINYTDRNDVAKLFFRIRKTGKFQLPTIGEFEATHSPSNPHIRIVETNSMGQCIDAIRSALNLSEPRDDFAFRDGVTIFSILYKSGNPKLYIEIPLHIEKRPNAPYFHIKKSFDEKLWASVSVLKDGVLMVTQAGGPDGEVTFRKPFNATNSSFEEALKEAFGAIPL